MASPPESPGVSFPNPTFAAVSMEEARQLALLTGAEAEAAKREEFKREVAEAALAEVRVEMSAVGQAVNQQLAQFEERLLQVLAGGPAVAVQGFKVEPGGESPAG